MGSGGGAAGASPQAVPAAPLPYTAAEGSVQKEEQDFPLVIASMPATGQHRTIAAGIVILLIVAAAVIAPFASIQVARVDAFIPVLQTVLTVVEFITAVLLFAQFSIQPQPALLALASGYIFSGSFAFLQTLAFPGGYAPAGLIGDGPNTPAWFYVLWHTTFPAAIFVYALTKDAIGVSKLPVRSTKSSITITVVCVLAVIAVLTWIVTAKTEYIPSFFPDDIRLQTQFGNQVNLMLWLWGATVLTVLLSRSRTILDLWLMVTLLACMPNFLVAMVGSSIRFTVGWYAARGFVLFGSCTLLTVLLIEKTFLYSRLANALILQRRERTNRLLTVDAVTGAIRELSKKTTDRRALTRIEDAVRLVLRLLQHDLHINEVSVTTEFQDNLPEAHLDGTQLQQVLLNLVKNAIEAMSSVTSGVRFLRLTTSFDGRSTVLLSVQDSGPGISAEDRERIFDPFFTTKFDGTGLGLAISSTLVANYGGKLRLVKSDSDGSIFELAIPVGGQRSAP